MINRRLKGRGGKVRAQALVEFALAFTIFLLILLAIMEFGRLIVTYSSVYTASREAARYGAAVETYDDCSDIRAAAVRVGAFGGVQASQVNIIYPDKTVSKNNVEYTCNCNGSTLVCNYPSASVAVPPPGLGDRVMVSVNTPFKFIVLALPEITISSTTYRTILIDVKINEQP